jgi:hypothetical protein
MSNGNPLPATSPAGTVQGYSFRVWLAKNKDKLKLLLAGAAGVGSFYLGKLVMPDVVSGFAATAMMFVTSWVSDLVDFWINEVPLTPSS